VIPDRFLLAAAAALATAGEAATAAGKSAIDKLHG
jgi:hypothetical protein